MNGPRELFTVLLQYVATMTAAVLSVSAWIQWHVIYPFSASVEPAMQQVAEPMQHIGLIAEQMMQPAVHLFLPALDEIAMMTLSMMDVLTVVTVYSLYVWTDTILHTVQQLVATPSAELSIESEVPGGIAVWLVVAVALVTYAFVYRQYPSHQDWVGTVISFVLPLLTRSLWKSD